MLKPMQYAQANAICSSQTIWNSVQRKGMKQDEKFIEQEKG